VNRSVGICLAIAELAVPTKKSTLPHEFLDEDEHHQQLHRCLTDETIPLEIRIAGALIRLYAMPVTRIVALTTDRFHRDEDGAYLIIDRHPVLLPPTLARLIQQQINRSRRYSMLARSTSPAAQFLLPGKPPDRPRHVSSVYSSGTRPTHQQRPQHRTDRGRRRAPTHRAQRPVRLSPRPHTAGPATPRTAGPTTSQQPHPPDQPRQDPARHRRSRADDPANTQTAAAPAATDSPGTGRLPGPPGFRGISGPCLRLI
jgi:hypothetical protein